MPVTTISYGADVRSEIIRRLENGETLTEICRDSKFPNRTTVNEWAAEDAWGIEFARARRAGFDARAEGLLTIAADDSRDPNSRKVQLDVERWLLSKQRPDIYGDRLAHQMLDEHGKPAKAGITIIVDGAPGSE